MAATPYFAYGGSAKANIVLSIADGWVRIIVEVMLLLHLVSAFPIILNPPAQFFEHIMNIPSGIRYREFLKKHHFNLALIEFNWKRCIFRTVSVMFLLFIAETVPSFGSILDLVGASTVTMLTFVCPPYFYMRLVDSSKDNSQWTQRFVKAFLAFYFSATLLFILQTTTPLGKNLLLVANCCWIPRRSHSYLHLH